LKTGFFGGGAVIGASIFFAALASGAVVPNHTNNGSLDRTNESNIVQENTQVADAAELTKKFSELNYYLPAIREGREDVPRFILAKLPSDLVELNPVKLRKELFIQALLPIVLQANEEILIARSRLIDLNAIPESKWSFSDRVWLIELTERYNVDEFDYDELLRRVDVVPPSLALAQAAVESGWGTSRFAQEGNAVFGQWTFEASMGIVPAEATSGSRHYIRAFKFLSHSVKSYLVNLNSHFAYSSFRNRRKLMRDQIGYLDPFGLANTLIYYSEQREKYVSSLRIIIERNNLAAYDQAQLRTVLPLKNNKDL